MKRLSKFIVDHPLAIIIIGLVVSVLALFGLLMLYHRPILEGDMPQSEPREIEDKKIRKLFSDREYIVFNLECEEGVFTKTCLSWLESFIDAVEKIDGISSPVQSLYTYDYIHGDGDDITIAPLLGRGAHKSPDTIAGLKELIRKDKLLSGRLVSKDEYATLVWFTVSEKLSQHEVYNSVTRLKSIFESGKHRVNIYAADHINEEIDYAITKDIVKLLPLGILFICVFVGITLGWRSVLLINAVVLLSTLWCFGFMGYLGVPMSVLTGTVPLILVAVTSTSGIHLIHRMRHEYKLLLTKNEISEEAKRILVRNAVWNALDSSAVPSIILSGVTSAIGFVTLMTMLILSVREFGIYAGAGILCGTALSLFLIPALVITILPKVVIRPREEKPRFIERYSQRLLDRCYELAWLDDRAVVFYTAVLVFLLGIGITQIRIGSNPPHYFPNGSAVRESFDSFDKRFGGEGFATIVFDSGTSNGVESPRFLSDAVKFQKTVEKESGVAFCTGLPEIVKRLNQKFTGRNGIPESANEIASLIDFYSFSAIETLYTMVDPGRRYMTIDCLVYSKDSAFLDSIYHRWKSYANTLSLKESYFGGQFIRWGAQNRYIVLGKLTSVATGLVLVFFCCAFLFRSWVAAFIAITPVVLASVMVFGVMGFLGIRLDLATCVITSIVIGVGIDYSVHLINRMRELRKSGRTAYFAIENGLMSAGHPILLNCVANFSFLLFVFSLFVPVRNFGWLVSMTMITAATATLIIVPLLIMRYEPKFLFFKEETHI